MKKAIPLTLAVLMSLSVLLTGCGSSEQAESTSESSSAAQMEDTSSSEAESSSEPEASEPEAPEPETPESNIVPEEPEESDSSTVPESGDVENGQVEEENSEMQMNVQVGGSTFTATLEENAAADALVDMMEQGPVTIQMSDYSGFEKVGPLGTSLPASSQQTTTQAGDIVLYQGNQIVMFYGSNSWSYTRLGHINDLTGWKEALGNGDVTVTLSLED
ncbi:MAG TPA: hypothetical protein K8V78_01535 [Lacrimispora saccharolytica]|nr:hypothetical protein [Lacrimispora saccharolytica]